MSLASDERPYCEVFSAGPAMRPAQIRLGSPDVEQQRKTEDVEDTSRQAVGVDDAHFSA
jgi:hypothetical protein